MADGWEQVGELLANLGLSREILGEDGNAAQAQALLPLKVPRSFARLMRLGDARDPLLIQVLPRAEESLKSPGFQKDPLDEAAHVLVPAMIQKYQGRAVVLASRSCAIHCRFCFRRHSTLDPPADLGQVLRKVAISPDLSEIILSGGDPLTLDDDVLGGFTRELSSLPHVRRLRVHSRLPVVIPERVTDDLLSWLAPGQGAQTLLVLHVNHPREMGPEARSALSRLREAGVPLLSQSVLLRGVNDSAETLAELSETLFEAGVTPYYLHLLDRVQGAAHFEVAEDRARLLHQELQTKLPGYLVPRLVRDVPGAKGKQLLCQSGP